jgi:hypothetical protein
VPSLSRSSSNAAATLLPSRIPPATSDGKWTPTYTREVPIVAASPSSAARAIGPAPRSFDVTVRNESRTAGWLLGHEVPFGRSMRRCIPSRPAS